MARTAKITLGEQEYTIRAFNLGELEEIGELIETASDRKGKVSFEIIKMALRRADPKVDDAGTIEATMDQVSEAATAILELAGLKTRDQAPGDPPAGQETTGD